MVRHYAPVGKPLTRRDLAEFDEANEVLDLLALLGAGPDGWHHYQAFLFTPGVGQVQVATGRNRGEMLSKLRQRRITGPVVIEGPGQCLESLFGRLPVYRFEDGQVTGRLTRRQARQWAGQLVEAHEGFLAITQAAALYSRQPWPPRRRPGRPWTKSSR
jgi:hypothetical protein